MYEQDPRTADFIAAEAEGTLSRAVVTVASGQDLKAGAVMGRVLAATDAADAGNTGDGTLAVGNIGSKAVEGGYSLVCVAAATDGGTFNFYAPDGTLIRQVTVDGTAHDNDHIVVTLTDGAADFAVGDEFTIDLDAGEYEQVDPAGTDGSQIADAIAYEAVDATGGAASVTAIVRHAEVVKSQLVFADAVTTAEQDTAIAELARKNIIARS